MDTELFTAWKAFFTAGFAAQKMVFLPEDAPQDAVDAFTAAFQAATEVDGFAEASAARLGVYTQGIGADAEVLLEKALDVSDEDIATIQAWLAGISE